MFKCCTYKLNSGTLLNGKVEGDLISFYKNGDIYAKFVLKNSLLNGKQVVYWPSGNLQGSAVYDNGVLRKDWRFLNDDGQLMNNKMHEIYKKNILSNVKGAFYE